MKPIIVTLIILQCLYITGLGVCVHWLRVQRALNVVKLEWLNSDTSGR